MSSTPPPVTRTLAEFAVALRYEDLPPDIVASAKRCILDSLGCGLYGSATPWTHAVARTVAKLSPRPTAGAWGLALRADALGAALINGTAVQGFELDDAHDSSMSHYGAGVVPSALAMAESIGSVDGRRLILAVVAGYELGMRIGNTVSPGAYERGFHPCGLNSTFAAAAAIAKLLDLALEGFVNALGLAGSQAAGLMAAQFGAMAKRFHSGKAAQNGMLAALLAEEGLTGIRDVIEAPYGGFCSTYADEYNLGIALEGLGSDWEMRKNGFKRYANLASGQSAVDALRAIREAHTLTGHDVASVHIETTKAVHHHCGWRYVPAETITAQMNLPYTSAVTLLEGDAFIDQYADDKLRDPVILDLADRVEVSVAPDLEGLGSHERRAARVTVITTGGDRLTETVIYRSGHWKNPLSDAALTVKFRDLASRIVTAEAVAAIEGIVSTLDRQAAPVATLSAALQDLRDSPVQRVSA